MSRKANAVRAIAKADVPAPVAIAKPATVSTAVRTRAAIVPPTASSTRAPLVPPTIAKG